MVTGENTEPGGPADHVGALNAAAAAGDLDGVRALLAADAGLIDCAGPHPYWGGRPRPLHVAVEWGREEVVRALLAAGAEHTPDSAAYDGWTPLFLAAAKGHDAIERMLRDVGAASDVWTASLTADEPAVRAWLRRDPALVRAAGPNRATPLHFAGSVAVAELLVAHGADLGALDLYGRTPLRVTAYSRRAPRAVARYLFGLGAEDDVFLRCALDDREAVAAAIDAEPALLHARGEHLDATSARGGTLLHLAASLSNLAMATLLLDRGADPNVRGGEGGTPLHYAAKLGDRAMADLLIDRGSDPGARDTAVDAVPAAWADFFGWTELASVLEARARAERPRESG